MCFRTDDPISDFERHDSEQQSLLDKLPECSYCGEKIQDEFCYEINGELICDDCMDEHHRKGVEDCVC